MSSVESLVALVVRADAFVRRKQGLIAARYRPGQRFWIEPFFNFIGSFTGFLILLLPGPLRDRVHLWVCGKLARHAPEPFPDLADRQKEAVARAQALYRQTGHWPAILFLTSHPDTLGPWAWLRFELLRQGLWICRALMEAMPKRYYRSHPQCFLAIDPFALDSVPVPVGALYSGFMHRQYLVWDRQHSTQSWLQRHWLLRGTGHDRVAWRLLRALRRNPVLMVLAGGLPQNARLFYAAREWAGTLKDARHIRSKSKIRHHVMDLLSTPVENQMPTEYGRLSSKVLEQLKEFLTDLGYASEAQDELLRLLVDEFKEEIPIRLRFWTLLHKRLALRGIPILAIPLTHYERQPHVRIGGIFEMTDRTDPEAFARSFNSFFRESAGRI